MSSFEIYFNDIVASEFQSPASLSPESETSRTTLESFLPKDYDSLPIFSYNIDTTKNLTWDSDAQFLHELWMQNAKNSSPHDKFPHAAIKRLMRLNPEVFQVCSEVLGPFSLLADMFVGMLLLGSSGNQPKQPTVVSSKDIVRSCIVPNPLLIWALDAINVDEILDLQTDEDYTIYANVLPELLVRQYPKNIKKKLIEAHFRLLDISEGALGEIPRIIDASGHEITRSVVLGSKHSCDFNERTLADQNLEPSKHALVLKSVIEPAKIDDQYHDFTRVSDHVLPTHDTEIQNLHEIEEMLCAAVSSDCHSNANSSQMEFVSFFSHIDPIWFPGEVDEDNFEEQLFTREDGAIECV
jgi:hypothetical protein